MNWKFEAIDKLKHYEAKKRSMALIPEEMGRLESVINGIRSATADGNPVKGGGSGREDMLLSNIVHREELKRCLEEVTLWVDIVENALAVLHPSERLILERFYIKPAKGNVERLCSELGIEQSTVYRRREQALYHFTVALYGCTEN